MSHHHEHSTNFIKTAFWLNLLFTIIEIVGGFLTNSVAILSDALHDFGDCLSIGFAWYFHKLSHKKRDEKFTYGYKRFSLLSAIVNSLVLLGGSIIILTETIPRLIHPQEVDSKGMILLAILGVIVNGAAVLRLRKGNSLNEKVIELHLLEDVLGWIAVLIGSLIMLFTKIPIIDPILSILITSYILFNVFKNLKKGLSIFLQSVPENIYAEKIEECLLKIKNIIGVHDIHLWSLDGSFNIVTLHIVVNNEVNSFEEICLLKKEAKKALSELELEHATIEIETENEICEQKNC